jgi:hypothetical protein
MSRNEKYIVPNPCIPVRVRPGIPQLRLKNGSRHGVCPPQSQVLLERVGLFYYFHSQGFPMWVAAIIPFLEAGKNEMIEPLLN